jgi:hypothetical protein
MVGAVGVAIALGLGLLAVFKAAGSGAFGGATPMAPGPLPDSVVRALAAAIEAQEGWGISGDVPTRYNNPGDLTDWPGLPAGVNGISLFPTAAQGEYALFEDIQNHAAANPGESLQGWIDTYAPASAGNDPVAYAAAVAAAVGVSPDTTFAQLGANA